MRTRQLIQPAVRGITDVLNTRVYDSYSYSAAVVINTLFTLFNSQQGQGGKTYLDTNLEQASRIPWDRMLVKAIGIKVFSRTAVPATGGEVNAAIQSIVANLIIAEKSYYRLPLHNLPASGGVYSNGVVDTGVNGWPTLTNLFTIDPIPLTKFQNMKSEHTVFNAIAAPAKPIFVEMFLDGEIDRSAL